MSLQTLMDHPWLSPAVLIGLVAVGLPAGPWLARRPGVAGGLAGLACVPVVLLTLTPVGVLVNRGCTLQFSVPTVGRVESFANVVLFVAPVFLLALARRRPLPAFLLGSVASAGIEAAQAFLPGRACDTNDWLNNTIGALIGALLAAVTLRARTGSRAPGFPPPRRRPGYPG